jgi:DNA-binding MarR family transcriptional regulator
MGSEPDVVVSAPALTLAVGARMLERALEDMTLPQFRVLSLIASSPERAGRIATMTGVSRPSLTGLLDGLVQRGWVQRVTVDGDRRGVSLEITDAGRAALDAAQSATAGRFDALLDELDDADRQMVTDGLAALGRAFEREGERRRQTTKGAS